MITVKRFAISLAGKFLAENESLKDSPTQGLLFVDIDAAAAVLKRWHKNLEKDWRIVEVTVPSL